MLCYHAELEFSHFIFKECLVLCSFKSLCIMYIIQIVMISMSLCIIHAIQIAMSEALSYLDSLANHICCTQKKIVSS